tara:strand:- start:1233 stop:2144 length:912 start_codon:yes stop_codon:yes gene_type:complete
MKVCTIAPNENWILDRIKKEWDEYSSPYSTKNYFDCDVLWFLDNNSWKNYIRMFQDKGQRPILVQQVNHVVPQKFSLKEFKFRDQFIDTYLVPCQKTYDAIQPYTNKTINILGYWVNPSIWRQYDKSRARVELGLPSNKYIIGSFQRDTEGHDLKSPKLEKGPDRFLKYIEKIDREKHILLGGWRRQYIVNHLKKLKIDYTYVEMAPIQTLRKMYAACDLYVVSSRYEGGPQAILECAAMKTPIVSTDVGVASDILSPRCVIEIENETYYPSLEDTEYNFNRVNEYTPDKQIKKYIKYFEGLK